MPSARTLVVAAAAKGYRYWRPAVIPSPPSVFVPSTIMSKRSSASGIANPYLKDKKPKSAAAVPDPSLNSTSSTASVTTSTSSTSGSARAVNPYAQQQNKRSRPTAAAAAGARASSPIDLTSSPESSPAKKKTKSITGSTGNSAASRRYKIFCDLDGVLVDFDTAAQRALNTSRKPKDLPPNVLWAGVARTPSFYVNAPWMRDGKKLWETIKHLNPDILTGVPTFKKAREDKAAWCRRELGVATNHVDMAGKKKAHEVVAGRRKNGDGIVNVITCWSRNKHCESGDRAVLIDDRDSLKQAWVAKGGIFIHHTKTSTTLAELRRLGILSEGKE